MKPISISIFSLCLLSMFSCKKLEDTVNKTAGNNDEGTITATIDGTPYTSPSVSAGLSGTTLFLRGVDFSNDEELSVTIDGFDATAKTFDIDLYHTTGSYSDKGGNSHRGVSGQVTIESATSTTAKGTFYFDTDDSMKITNGKFDLNWK